jgi:hypothetical protein
MAEEEESRIDVERIEVTDNSKRGATTIISNKRGLTMELY